MNAPIFIENLTRIRTSDNKIIYVTIKSAVLDNNEDEEYPLPFTKDELIKVNDWFLNKKKI